SLGSDHADMAAFAAAARPAGVAAVTAAAAPLAAVARYVDVRLSRAATGRNRQAGAQREAGCLDVNVHDGRIDARAASSALIARVAAASSVKESGALAAVAGRGGVGTGIAAINAGGNMGARRGIGSQEKEHGTACCLEF